jgi:putative hydrolase of the HAD superfamily
VLPFDVRRVWDALMPHVDVEPADARRRFSELLDETGFGRGQTSGPDFHRHLTDRIGLRLDLEQFRVAWSDMFWVDDEVVRLIGSANVKQRVLLSNTNEIHWDWILANYQGALAVFDRLLVSHECRCEKPDPSIYRMAIDVTGLPPEQHLFIDDIEENVRGARAVGMEAVLHTDAASLRREFEARGLVELR